VRSTSCEEGLCGLSSTITLLLIAAGDAETLGERPCGAPSVLRYFDYANAIRKEGSMESKSFNGIVIEES
jgi:hypothetical protein